MTVSKLALAVGFVAAVASVGAQATSRVDCENFGAIVGDMQNIRNMGGPKQLALDNLQNLFQSRDALTRSYGVRLSEFADYIWNKPVGNMDKARATVLGENFCVSNYITNKR